MTQPLRIAIAGLGTVGSSVISILENSRELLSNRAGRTIDIVAVSARAKRANMNYRFEANAKALAQAPDVDVVVELMGGAEGAARELVEVALANGKHVVTANKALIATHGAALIKAAEHQGVTLQFEAAVAGGIPILKTLREGLPANRIDRVMGILNGTCNYILTHMWEGKRDFDDVLAEAQRLGYAEADPTFDVGGIDAAHKLAILTSLAYGVAPDLATLYIEGITGITLRDMHCADELGYVIRLVGITTLSPTPLPQAGEGMILQRVHPCLVAKGSALANVRGVFNAVQVEGDAVGSLFMQGRGAGGAPTASAVIADIVDIARGSHAAPFGVPSEKLGKISSASIDSLSSAYYIRLGVIDRPGVLADITAAFRDHGISLKSFLQHGQAPGEKVYVIVATHTTSEAELKKALALISKQNSVLETPFSIRIEE